ncbi:unnamed protein product, partial [Iphiclides podalirius]
MMYPTDSLKHGPLKLNPFVARSNLDRGIMLKTIQSLCYKSGDGLGVPSPFLVDNILQQTSDYRSQYINQQLESYVLQRYEHSRDDSPEADEVRDGQEVDERRESIDESKMENDDDSKSREDEESYEMKSEAAYYSERYRSEDPRGSEKEVLSVPTLARRCHSCGAFDCPPYACQRTGSSGIRRLEELEKRFNLHGYQEHSGDEEPAREAGQSTDEIVRTCDDYEQKKPPLKFSVSAILGDRGDSTRSSSINGKRSTVPAIRDGTPFVIETCDCYLRVYGRGLTVNVRRLKL